jgi:hypothetical protein
VLLLLSMLLICPERLGCGETVAHSRSNPNSSSRQPEKVEGVRSNEKVDSEEVRSEML